MKRNDELGRSMLEVIVALSLGVLLIIAGMKIWSVVQTKSRAQAILQRVVAMKTQRQLTMLTHADKRLLRAEIGPYGTLLSIENGLGGQNKDFYWITVQTTSSALQVALQDEGRARLYPSLVTTRDNEVIFYFAKFNAALNGQSGSAPDKGRQPECPRHSVCDAELKVVNCENGYYLAGNSCIPCPTNYETCSLTGWSCASMTYYDSNQNACVPCGENIATCDNDGLATSCKDGYWGNDCSRDCPTEGVQSCNINGLVCLSGYYLSGEACVPCSPHVASCDDSHAATSCEPDWWGNDCSQKCPVGGVYSCDIEGLKCNAGYYLNGNVCTLCGEGKYTSTNGATECNTCESGYTNNTEHTACISTLNCGLNAHQIGSYCVCEPNYGNWQNGKGCCPTKKATLNESCEDFCGCAEGYKCSVDKKCEPCEDGEKCGCEGNYLWDKSLEKCVLSCSGNTPKTCSNSTDTWCCASGTGCSDTKNQCISGCEYSFEYPEIIGDACIYEVTSPTLTKIKGCTAGTYCYLRYSDYACNSWFSNLPKSGYIYGKCVGMTENETTITSQCSSSTNGSLGCCNSSEVITDMAVIKQIQSCSNGEYCYIRWDNNANLVNSAIGHFYGICLPKSENFGENYLNINSLADEDRYNPWKI